MAGHGQGALQELGYKVHTAATHSDFLLRFSQAQYQVVVVEELFGANNLEENLTLTALQKMTSSTRRHATVLLVGDSFQTFVPMEAFQTQRSCGHQQFRAVFAEAARGKGRRGE